jgi:hypothetical protein
MGIRDRLRRLEERFRDRGPSLDEIQAAWGRITDRPRAKLRGENTDERQRASDRDTIE